MFRDSWDIFKLKVLKVASEVVLKWRLPPLKVFLLRYIEKIALFI